MENAALPVHASQAVLHALRAVDHIKSLDAALSAPEDSEAIRHAPSPVIIGSDADYHATESARHAWKMPPIPKGDALTTAVIENSTLAIETAAAWYDEIAVGLQPRCPEEVWESVQQGQNALAEAVAAANECHKQSKRAADTVDSDTASASTL